MPFPEKNQPIALATTLVDLKTHRAQERTSGKIDPLIVYAAYTQENDVYQNGRIVTVDDKTYADYKKNKPNDLVNKFELTYRAGTPLLLHRKLADVLIDVAIDMQARYGQLTVVMDALRTFDSGKLMEQRRPDLVKAGLLAPAGSSAHNRALACDSKLFVATTSAALSELTEADEHGHLDDLDMISNSRFYQGTISDAARANRLNRIQAWQRASVKNQLPIANLLAEFWDDRVPGSPADMWRVLSCRALCIGVDGNPKTNPAINALKINLATLYEQNAQGKITRAQFAEHAHAAFSTTWNNFVFTAKHKQQLETILGHMGGEPPALGEFVFHEWLETIHDRDLVKAGFPPQAITL